MALRLSCSLKCKQELQKGRRRPGRSAMTIRREEPSAPAPPPLGTTRSCPPTGAGRSRAQQRRRQRRRRRRRQRRQHDAADGAGNAHGAHGRAPALCTHGAARRGTGRGRSGGGAGGAAERARCAERVRMSRNTICAFQRTGGEDGRREGGEREGWGAAGGAAERASCAQSVRLCRNRQKGPIVQSGRCGRWEEGGGRNTATAGAREGGRNERRER
eukprot:361518-Chlamydomonas_euryale.AAC.2